MYIKVQAYPAAYGPIHGMERYHFVEVEDDFHELPEDVREAAIQQAIEDAIFDYVEVHEEVLEGEIEDDEDY
jgi:hypothetical protein